MPVYPRATLVVSAAILATLSGVLALPAEAVTGSSWAEAEAIVKRVVPPTFPARDFSITDFGAIGDGRSDCRESIRKAIAACAEAGGGRVVLPRGTYFCDGPVRLASNVDLHLEKGTTLKFGPEPAKYLPPVLTRFEGTLLYAHSPRIYAYQCTNVAITGEGTIDGNGLATREMMQNAGGRGSSGALRKMGADAVPVNQRVYGEGKWLRSSLVQPFECTNVLIENVTLVDSMFWVVHPTLCRNVTVRGIHVNSLNSNNDGCDPDSSVDVLIESCQFNSGDDCIAIKSGRDRDGWTVNRPSENIVIRHCTMTTRHGAICIGSEMSGGVRNVFVEDCQIGSAAAALLFKSNLDRGGVVEHVRVRNITADRVHNGIQFETTYQGYRGGNAPPTFRDFRVDAVNIKLASRTGIRIEGSATIPVRNVLLRDVTVEGAKVPYATRDIADIRFEAVSVNGQQLPEFPPETSDDSAETKPSATGPANTNSQNGE